MYINCKSKRFCRSVDAAASRSKTRSPKELKYSGHIETSVRPSRLQQAIANKNHNITKWQS
eukprot:scaffold522242_cov32-Prasinocladus_malaysianus.AAC.1